MLKNDWQEVVGEQLTLPYFQQLLEFLEQEYHERTVYPPRENWFQALELTPYTAVKAVILGQDPYHGPGQAHGLSFSVAPGVPLPPSLRNMFKELQDDLEPVQPPRDGCLERWAEQGVLLLNTVLTVPEGEPNAHKGKGWETFTDAVIDALNEREEPLVFVLWGNHAQAKGARIDEARHLVLRAPHPSPLSARRGFFGSKPYSRINAWLASKGRGPIDWRLP